MRDLPLRIGDAIEVDVSTCKQSAGEGRSGRRLAQMYERPCVS